MANKESDDQMELKEWLAIRKEAGRKIDPETAEVDWDYRQTVDPYGLYPEEEIPEEHWQVGREYFARSPGSDIWVWFGDLPGETQDALWEKHKDSLAFPAGVRQKGSEIVGSRHRTPAPLPTAMSPKPAKRSLSHTNVTLNAQSEGGDIDALQ